jgi:hypothetical protein
MNAPSEFFLMHKFKTKFFSSLDFNLVVEQEIEAFFGLNLIKII